MLAKWSEMSRPHQEPYGLRGAKHSCTAYSEMFLLVETRIGPGFSGNSRDSSRVLSCMRTCESLDEDEAVVVIVVVDMVMLWLREDVQARTARCLKSITFLRSAGADPGHVTWYESW
jgi:hypothetical protein